MWIAISPTIESYIVPFSLRNVGSGISRYIRYSGVRITCGGSRFAAVKRISMATLKRRLSRVTTNATHDGEEQHDRRRRGR